MTAQPLDAVAVGIPARNESSTIESCLRSVVAAAAACGLPVAIAVAADDCSDDTAVRASAAMVDPGAIATGRVIEVRRRSAGGARDAACRSALEGTGRAPERVWLATTDADGTVPADWLTRQLAWAARGADAVAGLVEVDPTAPTQLRTRIAAHLAGLGTGFGHPHVHGANLGLRADLWLRAGGFADVGVGEDQALWDVLRSMDAHLVAAPDGIVRTSARLVGRAPDGFAAVLAGLVASEPRVVSGMHPSGIPAS